MNTTILLGGAHRGGAAITETALKYLPEAGQFKEVIIADPKEDRAIQLAQTWNNGGIRAHGIKEPCEEVVGKTAANSVLLAIDTISPMSNVLEKSPLPAQWQLMAKGIGPNGPIVGLSGTVGAGDTDERQASIKLIKELGSFIQPQSSNNIRENLLNADGLHIMRRVVSEHSVKRVGMLDRDPGDIPGGTLNFFWGGVSHPLVVQDKPSHRWKETKQQAMETNLPVSLRNSSAFAVATVGNKTVDFFIVETARGRRMIRFHMPLIHMLQSENLNRTIEAILRDSAITGVAAPTASAVVTD